VLAGPVLAGPKVTLVLLNSPGFGGFSPTMSSDLTQPGEPLGNPILALAASSRAGSTAVGSKFRRGARMTGC
jgi:hypothetical protein